MRTLSIFTLLILLAGSFAFISLVQPVYASSTYYVSPTPLGSGTFGGSCSAPGYNTIQAAVTAASPGDTIIVCPNTTYIEQVTISKSITLAGAGALGTEILLPSSTAVDGFGNVNVVTITGGATVSISGFTISGPGFGSCDAINYGIFVSGGASADISDNTIVHIRDNPLGGCQNGVGIGVGNALESTFGTATITGNTISDYQKGGIVVDGAGSSATITGNTITGVGPTTAIAQNGIQISNGATGTVGSSSLPNIVTGNECNVSTCGPDLDNQWQSAGILLYNTLVGPITATVSYNTVNSNDVGIALTNVDPVTLIVTHNTISDNRYGNLVLWTSSFADITYNTISVSSPSAAGGPCNINPVLSYCHGYSYTLGIDVLDGSDSNTISQNTVTVTADPYAILLDTSTSGNMVTNNQLSANHGATLGVFAIENLRAINTLSKAATTTTVFCSPASVAALSSTKITCTATVTSGYSPTGTVTWSKNSGTGSVKFVSTTCPLSGGSCAVTMTGTVGGTLVVKAAYGGDGANLGSSGLSNKLTITKATPSLTISCAKSLLLWGGDLCTATLTGYAGSVKGGTITWSKIAGTGSVSFSHSTCTLSKKGTCSVTVRGTVPGSVTIKASYAGDSSNYMAFSNTYVLTII